MLDALLQTVPVHDAIPEIGPAERANALRALAMDAVEKAGSGHPGMPMGMADVAEVLWTRHLRHDPADPAWWDRDRFVLSNGHGSMLLYGLLPWRRSSAASATGCARSTSTPTSGSR